MLNRVSCCLAIMKYNNYISVKLHNFANGEIILIIYAKLITTVNNNNTVIFNNNNYY